MSFALAPLAHAETALDVLSTDLRFDASSADLVQDAVPQNPAPPLTQAPRYGEPGGWWIGLGGGIAPGQTDGDAALDARLTLTTSTFLLEDFEFIMDWSLWGYAQEGDDTFGASWSFLFRLHFPFDDDKRTTFFVDGGVGLMLSAEEVPDHGTNVNFLPQLGAGLSHQLGDGPARIVGGVRWHHISNARIDGEDNNPSRDGAMFYVAYTFPF
ncbi:MAG: acyloxyacyl hydrolase [Phycisphaerales bacterium]